MIYMFIYFSGSSTEQGPPAPQAFPTAHELPNSASPTDRGAAPGARSEGGVG